MRFTPEVCKGIAGLYSWDKKNRTTLKVALPNLTLNYVQMNYTSAVNILMKVYFNALSTPNVGRILRLKRAVKLKSQQQGVNSCE